LQNPLSLKYSTEGRCFEVIFADLLALFLFHQIKVSIKLHKISFVIKYFLHDLIYDVHCCHDYEPQSYDMCKLKQKTSSLPFVSINLSMLYINQF